MRRMRLGVLLVCLAVGSAATPVRADDARSAARRHFEQGTSLYDIGKFREAAHEYEEAYKAKNDPALLYNIGQAYRLGGEAQAAMTAYHAYLRRLPTAPNRAQVEEHLSVLQRQLDAERRDAEARSAAVAISAPAASERDHTPLYKKWWLWAAVGGAAAVVVGVSVGVAYAVPKNAPAPAGTYTVTF
jgi:tetratricopeptide (TPR) repeat protein